MIWVKMKVPEYTIFKNQAENYNLSTSDQKF